MNTQLIKNKLSILLFFFPLTYLIGIAVVESFFLLFLIYLLFSFNKEVQNLFYKKIILILFLFSLYIILNAALQIPSSLKYSSIFYFRYLLFSISVCIFFENLMHSGFNKNLFLKFFILIILILLFDSFFQFFIGENIFGKKLTSYRVSSFFGDDLILGSYLIRLLPIIIWYLFYLKIDVNLNKHYLYIFFSIYFIIIYLSGERTAFALLVIFIILSLIFVPLIRKVLIGSTIVLVIFILSASLFGIGKTDITHRMFEKTYKQIFTERIKNEDKKISENKNYKKDGNFINIVKTLKVFSTDHQGHLIVAKNLFIDNYVFGVGPKGFRHFCRTINYAPKEGICSTHPHNVLAQFLSELGLVGFIFYIIFCIFFTWTFFTVYKKNKNNFDLNSYLIISIGLLIHLFPFLPNGNFFNNWISSFIYFKIGLLLYSYKKIFT